MGSNKKKLPVIVKFLVKKPLSFTYMLKIYDESQTNLYTLPVSGTSDNSILTTFPYISDR